MLKTGLLSACVAAVIATTGCTGSVDVGPIISGGSNYSGASEITTALNTSGIVGAIDPDGNIMPIVSAGTLVTYRSDSHFSVALLVGKAAGNTLKTCIDRSNFAGTDTNDLVNAQVNLRQVTLPDAKRQSRTKKRSFFFLDVRNHGRMSPAGFADLNICVENEAFKSQRIKWTNENLVL